MKPRKSVLTQQRQVIEKKLSVWRSVYLERRPPIGWVKAVRGALGMTTQQLADRLGIHQAGIVRLEEREAKGAVTLEMLERAAKAMNCKLVYAIVPEDGYRSLDEILNHQAEKVAKSLMKKVSHSMQLESQGVGNVDRNEQLKRLAQELKEKLDPRLWSKT